jgi:hypothetical protein
MTELRLYVDGMDILDEDQAEVFSVGQLANISAGVEDGSWSEKDNAAEFARLRETLKRNQAWFLAQEDFMEEVRAFREDRPRDHWWWWIEEL